MAKNKNVELKSPKKDEGVVETGKVTKKKSKSVENKKVKDAIKKEAKQEKPTAVKLAKSATTLGEKDLAKIEKKKAKKLAQKLKKQQKKKDQVAKDGTVVEKSTREDKKNDDVKKSKKKAAKLIKKKDEKNATSKQTETQTKSASPSTKKLKKKLKANDKPNRVPIERNAETEASTIFVGNLPVNTKRVQIIRLFAPYGKPKSIRLRSAGGKMLFKHKQRKSAGSLNAYVVLETPDQVEQALALNGNEFKEHVLRVTRSIKDSNDSNGVESDAKRTVFVGNLKYSANENQLREIFSSCGEIEYIRCLHDGDKGCKGVAYVCFKTADAVGLALELNETVLDERPIHVERYSVKKLGAKATRDAAAATNGTNTAKPKKSGAKKRIDKKKPKESNGKSAPNVEKKKSEFRGVKVEGIKKKQNKKKINSEAKKLAKKIAPKAK